ncbi:glycosyltransferase [Aeromicrobium sp. P5_D10]
MIGYYVHHQGKGHLHRAISVAAAIDTVVVGLSSLPRPAGWIGPWLVLPRDDQGSDPVDASARGRLHWVPEMDSGLTARMAEISSWIADVEPALMVVDVSAEVSLLARLHGTPVVTTVLPGDRRDSAHDLVHSVARRIIAAWPADVDGMVKGLDVHRDRLACVGGLSRFDGRDIPAVDRPGTKRVLVLQGAGNQSLDLWDLTAAQAQTPGWSWQVLGGTTWLDDPWEALCQADVVITHAGQNAIAEVAAARRPAVVVPQPRPFWEQTTMAAVLATDSRFPVTVCSALPETDWEELLDKTAVLDGSRWAAWNDGQGARRIADIIHQELDRTPTGPP